MGWLGEDDIAMYDLRYKEEQRFNPDQPRDDRGRWGDGSATVNEHLSKGHSMSASKYPKGHGAEMHDDLHNAGSADHGHPDRTVNVVSPKPGLVGLVKAVSSLGPYNTPSPKGDATREHVNSAYLAHRNGDIPAAKQLAAKARDHAAAIGGRQGDRLRDTLSEYIASGHGQHLDMAGTQAKVKNLGQ